MRRAVAATLLLLGLLAASPAAARRHRVVRPPAAGPPLGRGLTVDEAEWVVRPSKRIVAAGPVRIHIYNRGEDDHDLVLVDGAGAAHVVMLKSGADAVLTADLAPGRYRLFCSLQAGTPESHEDRGMWTTLDAR